MLRERYVYLCSSEGVEVQTLETYKVVGNICLFVRHCDVFRDITMVVF